MVVGGPKRARPTGDDAMAFRLSSAVFADGASIPKRHTCDGADLSPPLAWSGGPAGAKGFALVLSDADAPGGTWYHWAVFDIPAAALSLDEAQPKDAAVGAVRQGLNDFRRTGYGGPCPPRGHGVHRYRFLLTALDVASLGLKPGAGCREVEREAKRHALGEAHLVGTYGRT
jgi:Raf kinase inhibitor-like YbhB/YbcL family protein